MWRRQWEQVIPFFAYPPDVRKMIYTTNAIESLHMQLRKIVKNRGHFPNDQAAKKLRFLALRSRALIFENICSRKYTVQRRIVQRFFHRRIRQTEPLLQKVLVRLVCVCAYVTGSGLD